MRFQERGLLYPNKQAWSQKYNGLSINIFIYVTKASFVLFYSRSNVFFDSSLWHKKCNTKNWEILQDLCKQLNRIFTFKICCTKYWMLHLLTIFFLLISNPWYIHNICPNMRHRWFSVCGVLAATFLEVLINVPYVNNVRPG